MSDTTTEAATEPVMDEFDRIALEVIPDSAPEEAESGGETPGEPPTLEEKPLAEAGQEAHSKPTDSPSPSGVADLARAYNEVNRAGVNKEILAGKTEDEILALGESLGKARADREREYQESLNRSAESSAEAGEPDGAESPARDEATPDALAAASTALIEEYGEEAARPHIALLEQQAEAIAAQAKANKALEARLDAEAQARQLAPLNEKVEAVWSEMGASRPALSEPGVRERVEALAQQIHAADEDTYKGMEPLEWMPEVLQRASDTLFGATPAAARRPSSRASAQPTAPAARSRNRPRTEEEIWDDALRKCVKD